MRLICIRSVFLALVWCISLEANAGDEYFEKKIRPLLHAKCSQCHGEQMQSGGIDFREASTVLGTAVVSGDDSSPLIRAVRYESSIKMPPGTKLAREEIDLLVGWVRMGAPWPGYEPVPESVETSQESVESNHWAFQPIADPEVPDIGSSDWARNEIDRFILAKLGEEGVDPSPEASKLTLLRRASFDLLGLPPMEADTRAFLADDGEQAFASLVERLLGSPHYGERWGRHWLDVARYADSTGVDEDHPFGNSWRYRDYVIDAFNDDLPFDQFVREQIAGDLLPPAEAGTVNRRGIVATGFLALGPMALAQRDPIQKKYDVVDEQIDTATKAFLGLTVACARCHDHKFDPILTSDYYALAGIFASTRTFDDWRKNGSRYYKHPLVEPAVYEAYRAKADALKNLERLRGIARLIASHRYQAEVEAPKIAAYMLASAGLGPADELESQMVGWWREYLTPRASRRAHLQRWRDSPGLEAAAGYADEVAGALRERIGQLEEWFTEASRAIAAGKGALPDFPREQPDSLLYRDLRDGDGPFDIDPDDVEEAFAASDRQRIEHLEERIEQARSEVPDEPPMANGVSEDDPVRQRIFRRGQHKNPGRSVAKRFPIVLAGSEQPEIEAGSGRRELAEWLVSEGNPLTARVIVNRVWLWHFGEGLVRTPNNYGLRGEPPTHPLLLDWLARRFIDSGWSIKSLHRIIMDSATYRMSSSIAKRAYERDPENRLWSRFERRRLTIEEVRDSYLMISGRLDRTVGGDTDLGSGGLAEFVRNNRRIDPDDSTRRSVYLPLMRNKLPNLLGLFDFGDATTANGKRSVTNVAPQALYLMNSDFAHETAARTADALGQSSGDRIGLAYRRVLGRPPTNSENNLARRYVRAGADQDESWASLCKMLLASNEFHYVE